MAALRLLVAALAFAACCDMVTSEACDPATCKGSCVCPSTKPPLPANGAPLTPEETPQFIVVTHDDAITEGTDRGMRAIIDNHKNRNGCNVPATFFVLKQDTDCALAKKFWEENSELAIHSTTHKPLTEPFVGDLHAEMFGARKFLNETCGIPLEDMVGFRTPLLAHRPGVRAEIAAEPGMLYDSSIPENYPSATSPDKLNRLWPYTMDHGIPQDCAFYQANCTADERYPGLFQVPLLEYENAAGTENIAIMDPGVKIAEGAATAYSGNAAPAMSKDALVALLKDNFNFSYAGNRAPFGIYIHTYWITTDTVEATNEFLEWALGLNDTWVVTNRQLLEWMQAPVPASQMADWLKCKPTNISKPEPFVAKKCQVHNVTEGDTGSGIAARYGVTLPDLTAANAGIDWTTIGPGLQLRIPPFPDSCGAGPPPIAKAAAATAAAAAAEEASGADSGADSGSADEEAPKRAGKEEKKSRKALM